MTDGHKHRHVVVPGYIVRALRRPLIHRPAVTNAQWRRVEGSPYPYGPCNFHSYEQGMDATCWTLSTLAILHRWTGLTLMIR